MPELRFAGLPQVYDWSAGLSSHERRSAGDFGQLPTVASDFVFRGLRLRGKANGHWIGAEVEENLIDHLGAANRGALASLLSLRTDDFKSPMA